MKYLIKEGDTLESLAQAFGVTASSIIFSSGYPERIFKGLELDIPVNKDLMFTAEQIQPISQYISEYERENITQLLNINLARWGIDEPLEIIHFLAQLSHESAGFKCRVENLNYSSKALLSVFGKYFKSKAEADKYHRQPQAIADVVYAKRMGNVRPGDGWKYRGRGYIQLTGYDNYLKCGNQLNLDLVNNPDLVSDNETVALLASVWYWNVHKLGRLALRDDLVGITKRINGGTHGLQSRKTRVDLLKKSFGI